MFTSSFPARPALLGVLLIAATVGCSGTKSARCNSCNTGAVYPPPGCYDNTGVIYSEPPQPTAPLPIQVPSASQPGTESLPAPPPPLGARVPAALQNIRYSTGEFFHTANENVRALFAR